MVRSPYSKLAVILLLLSLSSCYTLVKHPILEVPEEGNKTSYLQVMFYEDCSECHSDNELDKYDALVQLRPERAHETISSNFYSLKDHGFYDYFYNSVWWLDQGYNFKIIENVGGSRYYRPTTGPVIYEPTDHGGVSVGGSSDTKLRKGSSDKSDRKRTSGNSRNSGNRNQKENKSKNGKKRR